MHQREVSRSSRFGGRAARLLVVVTVALPVLTPTPGAAQDFFSFFGFGRHERTPSPRDEPRAYADPSELPPDIARRVAAPAAEPASRSTYCVRLCDGRFFPLTGPATASPANAAKTCSALCPASKTAVYRGGKIDEAVAHNGDRYADLTNAFVYRTKLVDRCTCNGKDPLGLARLDIATDPTLRPGDVVATAEGLKVFSGGAGEHHRSANFTPIDNTRKVSAEVRRHLATTRVVGTP
jgi:hypothetical protein